jgi:hypothetical protein
MTKTTGIKKFTTNYDINEDRIKISALLSDNTTCTVWLTNRFANILLSNIFKWLNKKYDPYISEIENSFKQEITHKKLKESAASDNIPVEDKFPSGILCNNINLSYTDKFLILKFNPESDSIKLILNEDSLRSWLAILYLLYKKAGWDTSIFPGWLKSAHDNLNDDSQRDILFN